MLVVVLLALAVAVPATILAWKLGQADHAYRVVIPERIAPLSYREDAAADAPRTEPVAIETNTATQTSDSIDGEPQTAARFDLPAFIARLIAPLRRAFTSLRMPSFRVASLRMPTLRVPSSQMPTLPRRHTHTAAEAITEPVEIISDSAVSDVLHDETTFTPEPVLVNDTTFTQPTAKAEEESTPVDAAVPVDPFVPFNDAKQPTVDDHFTVIDEQPIVTNHATSSAPETESSELTDVPESASPAKKPFAFLRGLFAKRTSSEESAATLLDKLVQDADRPIDPQSIPPHSTDHPKWFAQAGITQPLPLEDRVKYFLLLAYAYSGEQQEKFLNLVEESDPSLLSVVIALRGRPNYRIKTIEDANEWIQSSRSMDAPSMMNSEPEHPTTSPA